MDNDSKVAILAEVMGHIGRALMAAIRLSAEDQRARQIVERISAALAVTLAVTMDVAEEIREEK
jgi:hypothetical protein